MTAPTKPDQTRPAPTVTDIRPAGEDHAVITLDTPRGSTGYRRTPCHTCPWRVDATGAFPAEAFRHSAGTSYDCATVQFACHASGTARPRTCAGYLLNGSTHNLAARMSLARGDVDLSRVSDGGHDLHASYRAMAEANGVDPDDPVLTPCRDA